MSNPLTDGYVEARREHAASTYPAPGPSGRRDNPLLFRYHPTARVVQLRRDGQVYEVPLDSLQDGDGVVE